MKRDPHRVGGQLGPFTEKHFLLFVLNLSDGIS